MSYASVASRGPKQTPEEARAPIPPQVEQTEFESSSLIDVDSPHVSSVPSDYESQSIKTDTQAQRLDNEAEDAERTVEETATKGKEKAAGTYGDAKKKAPKNFDEAKKDASELYEEGKEKASDAYKKAKAKAPKSYDEAKKDAADLYAEGKGKAHRAGDDLKENSDNPVYVGNAVVIAAASAALGFGAYRKYAAGELTWKVVGAWAGVVGLFAAGDYYLSQYLFKNKYPKK